MELKDFLLLLFDKNIDRYPNIRESFLVNFNTYEVTNILAITNYHCKKKERTKYIRHSFNDTGIKIHYRHRELYPCIKDITDSKTSMPDISEQIESSIAIWIDSAIDICTDSIQILNISSSNTDFIISGSIAYTYDNLCIRYSDRLLGIKLNIRSKSSKYKTYKGRVSITGLFEEDIVDRVEGFARILHNILCMTSQEIYIWCNSELSQNKLIKSTSTEEVYYFVS